MTSVRAKPLALSKAFYAFYYAAAASLVPFLALYYRLLAGLPRRRARWGIYFAFETNYLFLYLDSLGVRKSVMGIALVIATVSELPVWALGPRMLEKWGARGVLGSALLATLAQAAVYTWLVPEVALPAQLLHGPAFSATWIAGVAYAAESAPEGTQATAQGLFGGVHMGLSAALGAFAGGWLFERGGGSLMFRWGVLTSLVALVLLWWTGKRR